MGTVQKLQFLARQAARNRGTLTIEAESFVDPNQIDYDTGVWYRVRVTLPDRGNFLGYDPDLGKAIDSVYSIITHDNSNRMMKNLGRVKL